MQSLERAFDILEIIAQRPEGVSFSKIAAASGLPEGTVGRLLAALDNLGAVERLTTAKGYRIGNKLVALSSGVSFERQLKVMARPYLLELADATQETVNLGLYAGRQALYIDQVDSTYDLRTKDYTSLRYPLHVVSTGKVFLAYFSEAQLGDYLATPLVAYTDRTLTEPDALREQLSRGRSRGYIEAVGEAEEGLSTYAAPIFIQSKTGDKVVGAISVSAPTFRVTEARKERIVSVLKQCCQNLSSLLRRSPLHAHTDLIP